MAEVTTFQEKFVTFRQEIPDAKCRAIFGDQGYLISVWLTILSHDWTFNFKRKGEKSSKHPFEKI